MANVLPLDAQKKVSRLQRARLVIALAGVIGALALSLALALVPSYLALSWAAPPVSEERSGGRPATDPQTIARTQALITRFEPVLSATTSPSAYIAAVVKDRPAGVTVSHFAYNAAQGERPAEMLVAGVASREKISAYRDALSKNPLFTNVSVPVSALVGSDGSFSITLNIRAPQTPQL